jgi:hypothetical protein
MIARGFGSLPAKRECEICRSKYKLSRDQRSGRLLCRRCLYWQIFQGLVDKGDESSVIISRQLNYCYPNNVDKQKDLFIAVIEVLDEADRDHRISEEAFVRLAMKWRVERVVYEEMIKAVTESSSVLLKKAADRSMIPDEYTIQTD